MRLNRLFTCFLLMGILLTGCTTENSSDPDIDSSTKATIRFALGGSAGSNPVTRAEGASATLETEKKVNSVLAFLFYEDGSGLYDIKEFDNTNTEGEEGKMPIFGIEVKESGSYNLYLVANANTTLKQQLLSLTSTPETTLDDLGQMLADQVPDVDNEFLMTSKTVYLFQATPGNEVDAGTIALRRLSLRIDLVNMMNAANITKVTFKNRAVKSHLITGNKMPENVVADKVYDYSGSPIEGNVNSPGVLEGQIYGYENYSTTTPSELEITYTVAGADKTYVIKFNDPNSAEGGLLALKRNNFYRITLTDDMSVPFTMEVLDWDDAEAFTVDKLVTRLEPQAFTTNPEEAWFMVDPNNMKKASGEELMTWDEARYLCPSGWQVPNRSQLMMMWVYNDSKVLPHASKGIFMDVNHYMWSSSASGSNAWAVSGDNGHTSNTFAKSLKYAMRCIKVNTSKKYPYLDTDGRTIVSKNEDGGIDDKALLTSEQIGYMLDNNITDPQYRFTQNTSYNHVSPKFQVCANDPTYSGQTWSEAYTACANYSEVSGSSDKGKWRLPTQRELMLMFIMKSNTSNSKFTLAGGHTWSGTNAGGENACSMNFQGFMTTRSTTGISTDSFGVRCVRDIRE